MLEGVIFLCILINTCFLCFKLKSSQWVWTRIWYYLFCVPLMTMMLNIFSCACWPFMCLLWKRVLCESESCLVVPDCCNPMCYTVYGILQARILEWVAFPFFRESSQLRDQTQVSCIAGRFFTNWVTREAHLSPLPNFKLGCFHIVGLKSSLCILITRSLGFPGGSVVKNPPPVAGDVDLIPGWTRCLGEGNGNPVQYSCLENPVGRRTLQVTLEGVTGESGMTYGLNSSYNKIIIRCVVCRYFL